MNITVEFFGRNLEMYFKENWLITEFQWFSAFYSNTGRINCHHSWCKCCQLSWFSKLEWKMVNKSKMIEKWETATEFTWQIYTKPKTHVKLRFNISISKQKLSSLKTRWKSNGSFSRVHLQWERWKLSDEYEPKWRRLMWMHPIWASRMSIKP